MCQTSFSTFHIACGHTQTTSHACQHGPCPLSIPHRSLESLHMCPSCSQDHTLRLPLFQRIANHRISRSRIDTEINEYAILLEQRALQRLDLERQEEERELARLSALSMTAEQAERIMFLYDSRLLIAEDEPSTEAADIRIGILKQAYFQIPLRLIEHWPERMLQLHVNAMQLYRGNPFTWREDLHVRPDHLAHVQRNVFGIYAEVARREVVRLAEVEVVRGVRVRSRVEREELVRGLLVRMVVESLPDDEFSRRCNICMETMGSPRGLDEGGQPVRLPCGHVYGEDCISIWLQDNDTCGFCRRNYWKELGSEDPDVVREEAEREERESNVLSDFGDEDRDMVMEDEDESEEEEEVVGGSGDGSGYSHAAQAGLVVRANSSAPVLPRSQRVDIATSDDHDSLFGEPREESFFIPEFPSPSLPPSVGDFNPGELDFIPFSPILPRTNATNTTDLEIDIYEDELEPIRMDADAFMGWGLGPTNQDQQEEGLEVGDEFDEIAILRMLDEDRVPLSQRERDEMRRRYEQESGRQGESIEEDVDFESLPPPWRRF